MPGPIVPAPVGHQAIARLAGLGLNAGRGLRPLPGQHVVRKAQAPPPIRATCRASSADSGRRPWSTVRTVSFRSGCWLSAQSLASRISAVESDPPETASATWRSRRSGEKSAGRSGSAAGTLGFGLGALAGVDRLGIFRAHRGIGRAGLFRLAQPVERDAELQQAVGRAAALGIFLVALQEIGGGALEVALGIEGLAQPILRAAGKAVIGVFLQEVGEARLRIAELAAQQAFVRALVERLRAIRQRPPAPAPRSRWIAVGVGLAAGVPCWTNTSSPGSCWEGGTSTLPWKPPSFGWAAALSMAPRTLDAGSGSGKIGLARLRRLRRQRRRSAAARSLRCRCCRGWAFRPRPRPGASAGWARAGRRPGGGRRHLLRRRRSAAGQPPRRPGRAAASPRRRVPAPGR